MKTTWLKIRWVIYTMVALTTVFIAVFLLAQSAINRPTTGNPDDIPAFTEKDQPVIEQIEKDDNLSVKGSEEVSEKVSEKNTVQLAQATTTKPVAPKTTPKPKPAETKKSLPEQLDFTLKDLKSGKDVKFSDVYGEKLTFLNFWASWCGPCKAEIPSLVKLHETYKDRGFCVVSVSTDQGDLSRLSALVDRMSINYPVLLDGSRKVSTQYGGITGIPTTFVINSDGVIIEKLIGARDHIFFENLIKANINK